MHKVKLLVDSMRQEFFASPIPRSRPTSLELRLIKEGKGEAFEAEYAAGKVRINAESPLAAAYGMHQMQAAIESGHLSEFLGTSSPRFPLRVLWVGADMYLSLNDQIKVGVPYFFSKLQGIERFCQVAISLGFNAIIFGEKNSENLKRCQSSHETLDFSVISACLHAFGLKVIVKPTWDLGECRSPTNQAYRKKILDGLKVFVSNRGDGCDFIFWNSEIDHPSFLQSPDSRNIPAAELLEKEMQMLEEALGKAASLIYCVPVSLQTAQRRSKDLISLSQAAGSHTFLAFSAVCGPAYEDHLPPHPLWEMLRSFPYKLDTPLLPIVNLGGINQGEGLWPALPFDIYQRFFSKLYRHAFAGAISLVNHLPSERGILHGSLWIGGQMLWRERSADALAETWFYAFRKELNALRHLHVFAEVRRLILDLSALKSLLVHKDQEKISSDECRTLAEHLIAVLQRLFIYMGKELSVSVFSDYFLYFNRDARRIILSFLQQHHAPLAKLLVGSDSMDSFWTQTSHLYGDAKVIFLDSPFVNPNDSKMIAVYRENRLLFDP